MSRQGSPGLRRTEGVPPMPSELARGRCVGHPHAHWWRSFNAAEVEAAIRTCHACPVEQVCRDWALSLRQVDDQVMTLGGLSASARAEIRKQRKRRRAA